MKRVIAALFAAVAVFSLAVVLTGCAANGTPAVSAGEIAAWDTLLTRSVAIVRASVAAQPAGPKRDALLKQIDQVSTWEALAAAVSEAVAAGVDVKVPATQPSVN